MKTSDVERVPLIEAPDEKGKSALTVLDETIGRMARADETPFILVSDAIQRLIDEYGVTQQAIARHYRRTQPTISNYYSLQNLIAELRECALNGRLKTFRAALWLSKMTEEDQRQVYQGTLDDNVITQKAVLAYRSKSKGETISLAGAIDIPDSNINVLPTMKLKLPPGGLQVLWDTGEYSLDVGGRTYIIIAEMG